MNMYELSDLGHILLCNRMLLSWLTSLSIIGHLQIHHPRSGKGEIHLNLLDGTTHNKVLVINNHHIG